MQSPDQNVENVREMLLRRSVVGLEKYNVTTESSQIGKLAWLRHAQEEALDLSIYLEKLIQIELGNQK